ncbi:Homocysteine S-methyltransferase [Linderina pennispora]|uniref:Homocysteine S-methyltransferase n=1 Tax=Linderina pennispora TaxID=61395 RepID=A0A1Y1WKM8_9FUNG|nr:Homocysteine S-methyltransferase [Linderina pennispora]ORX73644.1 Homocysteine S-methyltransferase [Linderina pennispora]
MSTAERFIHGKLLEKAVIVLDGGLGTELRKAHLTEADYRGALDIPAAQAQQGNCALLSLTQRALVQTLHERFLEAGADIIQTNTFCANVVDQNRFYGIGVDSKLVAEMNRQSVRIALDAVARSGRNALVCGSVGPTHAAVTIETFEHIHFEELFGVYCDQIRALVEGGCRVFLVESVMDWVNARAAMAAIHQIAAVCNVQLQAIVSAGVGAKDGRIMSGQSWEEFARAFAAYPNVLAVGQNCGDCAPDFSSSTVGRIRDSTDACYSLTPETFAAEMARFVGSEMVDMVGGCCGITPMHIRAMASQCNGESRTLGSALRVREKVCTVSGHGALPSIVISSTWSTDDIASAIMAAVSGTGSAVLRVQFSSSGQSLRLLCALAKRAVIELSCTLVVDSADTSGIELLLERAPCMCLTNVQAGFGPMVQGYI